MKKKINFKSKLKRIKLNKKSIIAIAVIILVLAGIIAAVCISKKSAKNIVTIGDVKIEYRERFNGKNYNKTSGSPEIIKRSMYNGKIEKKPKVVNKGSCDAYIYFYVKIPMIKNTGKNDDVIENAVLVNILNKDGMEFANYDWSLIQEYKGIEDSDGMTYNHCLYGYSKKLAPDSDSSYLFNKIKVAESDNLPDEMVIPITAYAIECDLAPEKTDSRVSEEQLKSIWDECVDDSIWKEPENSIAASFAGYYEEYDEEGNPVEDSFVDAPKDFTWQELTEEKDAEIYKYGSQSVKAKKDNKVSSGTISKTKIGENAFAGTALKSINVPEGVKTIDTGAFDSCVRLLSVNIPSSLKRIYHDAFKKCSQLEEINLPVSVTIDDDAFPEQITQTTTPSSHTGQNNPDWAESTDKHINLITGTRYIYNGYEYRYNQRFVCVGWDKNYKGYKDEDRGRCKWVDNPEQNGWGVRYLGDEFEPGKICKYIDGEPVVNMSWCFVKEAVKYESDEDSWVTLYSKITIVPEIPETVTDLSYAFYGAKYLTAAPTIPSSVVNLDEAFTGSGVAEIPTLASVE